jgi:hypothetical protein
MKTFDTSVFPHSQPTTLPLTPSVGAFPARMYRKLVEAMALRLREAVYGSSLRGSLARYDHRSSSWKTCLVLSQEDSTEFSGRWPQSGMMRSGILYPCPSSGRHIEDGEYGLLPTPTVGGGGQTLPKGTTPTGRTPDGRKQTVCLERYLNQVRSGIWPIPKLQGSPEMFPTKAGGRLGLASLRTFVEWMMGYDLGWTRLPSGVLATPSRRKLHK